MPTATQQALLTDLYQLTMAFGYWKAGRANHEAVFNLFFRKPPFGSGYTVACGLAPVIDFIEAFRFQADDIEYLASLTGNDGERLFEKAFLDHLAELRLAVTVHGVPEGTVVFPHEPLLRIRGPILHCQLVETALLNIVNFETLVATKAARVCLAARGDAVLEFGLRRAQGIDGGLAASRAAYLGGCAATSNVLAGKLLRHPGARHPRPQLGDVVRSTSSRRSRVRRGDAGQLHVPRRHLRHDRGRAQRDQGRARACAQRGHELVGIRLDSGDLAYLSTEARKLLDEAGFPKAVIVASNDLDEHLIQSLKGRARRSTSGASARSCHRLRPARARRRVQAGGRARPGPALARSRQAQRASRESLEPRHSTGPTNAARRRVHRRRHLRRGTGARGRLHPRRPDGCHSAKLVPSGTPWEDLLVPIFQEGRRVYDSPTLAASRARTAAELAGFDAGVKRLVNPQPYPVGLERKLHGLKTKLILEARHLDPVRAAV